MTDRFAAPSSLHTRIPSQTLLAGPAIQRNRSPEKVAIQEGNTA